MEKNSNSEKRRMWDEVVQYLDGDMSPEEEARFVETAKTDETLQSVIQTEYVARRTARQMKLETFEKKMAEAEASNLEMEPGEGKAKSARSVQLSLSDLETKPGEAKIITFWKRRQFQAAAAVALILGFAVWMMLPSPDHRQLTQQGNGKEDTLRIKATDLVKLDAYQLPLEHLGDQNNGSSKISIEIGVYHDPAAPARQYEFDEQEHFLSIYLPEASGYQKGQTFRLVEWQGKFFLRFENRWLGFGATAKGKRKELSPVSDPALLKQLSSK